MLVIEVSINSTYQNAAIPVPNPAGYGQIINAAHNYVTDKVMATVMKSNPRATGLIPNLMQKTPSNFWPGDPELSASEPEITRQISDRAG